MRKSKNYYKFMEYMAFGISGCSTVHAYNGKYGKGVVRTRPCFYKGRRSTNYMTIEYWISRDDIQEKVRY